MALVPQMVDTLPIPVIASGGIMDGRGLAATRANNPEFMSLWAGQGLRLAKEQQAAAEIVKQTVEQARIVIGDLGRGV